MPTWNKIKKSLGDIAGKTAIKTRELTDTASLKIKIASKESERDIEYKALGKLAYAKLRQPENNTDDDLAQKISASLDKLESILKELDELKELDKARREAKEAEKKARENEKQSSEELDLAVMEDFNAARKVADAEYEKAKRAAEDAKAQS